MESARGVADASWQRGAPTRCLLGSRRHASRVTFEETFVKTAKQFIQALDNELVSLTHIVSIRFTSSKKAQLKLSDGRVVDAMVPLRIAAIPAAISAARSVESVPLAQG